MDVRIDSATVERRKIGLFCVRGFDELRLEGVSVEIEGARAASVAVAPLLADALRELPVGGATGVAIERLAVEWRPAGAAPVRLAASEARARAGLDEVELVRPQIESAGAAHGIRLEDGI